MQLLQRNHNFAFKSIQSSKPEDVEKADLHFIDTIGLTTHLSPTRSNGLVAMIKQIKLYAMAFNIKNQNS